MLLNVSTVLDPNSFSDLKLVVGTQEGQSACKKSCTRNLQRFIFGKDLCGTWLNLDKSKNRLIKQKPILVVVAVVAAAVAVGGGGGGGAEGAGAGAAAAAAAAGVVVVVAVVLVCCMSMRNDVEPALTTS